MTNARAKAKSSGAPRQSDKFLEAARKHGADADNGAADRLMGRLAKMKPEPKPAARKSNSSKGQKETI